MLGLTTGTNFTKLSLHEISGGGRLPSVSVVSAPGLTTHDVPLPLVKNLLALHESAAPGTVKEFAKSMYKVGIMDELLTDAVRAHSPSKRSQMQSPESVMEAFYAASFLQNEEASECLVYSHQGRVVGMAQVGKFGQSAPGLECTISNLVVSPKLDAGSQNAIIRHIATAAKSKTGEATLLTAEPWGAAYTTHGFEIEKVGPPTSPNRDPIASHIMRGAGVSAIRNQENVVRCRWSS
jgi:hypothetical protein